MNRQTALVLLPSFLLVGCLSGKSEYIKPALDTAPVTKTSLINRPIDDVWKTTVSKLSARYFVINNIDRASGLINLSYTGDPEQFVDCGIVRTEINNAAGLRKYEFPASRKHVQYEYSEGGGLFYLDRTLTMEGRINLMIQEEGAGVTRATVNARYVLNKTVLAQQVAGNRQTFSDSIAFNTGQGAVFSPGTANEVSCIPTGRLENDVLEDIAP